MTLRLQFAGPVARVLLDRAAKRNAVTQAMWETLPALIAQAVAAPEVRVIVLTSATPGVFCAGADIGELAGNAGDSAWLAANQAAINRAQWELTRAAKPTVAVIDGDCVGGGCGLALACDLRVATARARLGITPAKLGLVYPLHDTKLLVDLVGPAVAKRMLYTGQLLSAEEAYRVGLVDMLGEADELLASIVAQSGHSQRKTKAMVRRILDGQAADDDATRDMFAEAFDGADFREGVAAFLGKRPPQFE